MLNKDIQILPDSGLVAFYVVFSANNFVFLLWECNTVHQMGFNNLQRANHNKVILGDVINVIVAKKLESSNIHKTI